MKYRIYYDKTEDGVAWWSIDEGTQDTEVRVRWISINPGVALNNGCNTNPHKPSEPSAWFETYNATCSIMNGGALFSAVA